MSYFFLFEISVGVFMTLLLLYKYFTSNYLYWKILNVPYLEPKFPFGNIRDQITNKSSVGKCYKDLYDKMLGKKYFGIFELGTPALVVTDFEIIKAILIKDFSSFIDRGHIHKDVKKDFIAAGHLFNLKNEAWKRMRVKLSPTFSSGRIKIMYNLMHKCSQQLDAYLLEMAENSELVELKDLLTRFTSDVISSCLFGLESNAVKDKDSEVMKINYLMFPASSWTMIKQFLSISHPYIFDFFRLTIKCKEVNEFCLKIAKETYKFRTESNQYRNDFIDLLIKIKQNKNLYEDEISNNKESRKNDISHDGLTFEEMAAQVFVMFAAGFETSSATSSFALYELCRHQDILAKALHEIDLVLQNYNGQITYDSLKEMIYLEKVILETLRLYPAVQIITRKCTKDYKIPNSGLKLKEGTRIVIPVYAINRDPNNFPDPLKFDPERFDPSTHRDTINLQFGVGPMRCIGMRFGMMQIKCALTTILSKYTLIPVPETPKNITLSPRHFLAFPMEKLLYKVSQRGVI